MRFRHFPLNTVETRRAMLGERPREKMKKHDEKDYLDLLFDSS